jgi:hypothetical protein
MAEEARSESEESGGGPEQLSWLDLRIYDNGEVRARCHSTLRSTEEDGQTSAVTSAVDVELPDEVIQRLLELLEEASPHSRQQLKQDAALLAATNRQRKRGTLRQAVKLGGKTEDVDK